MIILTQDGIPVILTKRLIDTTINYIKLLNMDDDHTVIDNIVEDIFHCFPRIYKKLLKIDFEEVEKGMSYLHFLIIRILARTGPLPISEIGKRLMIPRPQMTHLIDQLIALDMAKRLPDTRDRRIVNIGLTAGGKATLIKCGEVIRDNITGKLEYLDDAELQEFSSILRKLNELTLKLK